jgi:hypothetical protein
MSSILRRRIIVFLVAPASIFLVAYIVMRMPYLKYTRGIYEFLGFLLAADVAIALSGKWRDAATVVATVIFGLAAIELICAGLQSSSLPIETHNFAVTRPVLGWGPPAPGVYHASKTGPDGAVIYDVDYTIDQNLLRQTLSAPSGPTVAFFGDSMTFGEGLRDEETMPQAFADLYVRRIRVLNFGFPGYGPQQFLRPLETGMFDSLLTDAKTFVYESAAWHAERASCRAGFMVRAPRYELRDGKLVFMGLCGTGINRTFTDIFMSGATYHRLIEPLVNHITPAEIEIYLAEMRRCAELVKEKYGARLIVLYVADNAQYLAKSGFTEAMIMARLRQSGIDVIDATPFAKDFPPGTLLDIPGDGHPSSALNRARAVLLQHFLATANTFKGAAFSSQ